MEENRVQAAFILAVTSAVMFVLSILTGFIFPDAGALTGFQLFVIPLALVALIFCLTEDKQKLFDNERKRHTLALYISITMILVPALFFALMAFIFAPFWS